MLKPRKKVTKKEMREDKLVTTYFEATKWYEQHKKLVSGALTLFIILAVVAVVVANNMRTNNERATTELGKILPYYDRGEIEAAIKGDLQQNVRGLQVIVDEYGSTRSGRVAAFYLASAYYEQGDFHRALENFLKVDVDDEFLMGSALAGAAACYEALGEHEKAAEGFERASRVGRKNVNAPEYLLHAAQNYVAAGKKARALELLKKLRKDHPTSPYAREVDRWIAQANA